MIISIHKKMDTWLLPKEETMQINKSFTKLLEKKS